MNGKKILQSIIDNFDIDLFEGFFRSKNDKLNFPDEPLDYEDPEGNIKQGEKLAEGELDDGTFIVCSFLVEKQLTERSGKKAQYILGKKILKDQQADAGIFIFYDSGGRFRFSLIYTNYLGKRRDWSNFKRFTYFVSKDQTNKTFLQQIGEGDFSTIEKIKEAFSLEPVTKQFYNEIQNWYFWALDKVKFPDDYKYNDDPAKDKEIRNATNLIRLITRIIFVWFLKEKGLVPADLFLKEKLENIVRDFIKNKKASNFYNAILQNLFFGTLNQKIDERKFTREGNFLTNRKEYGVKILYRYADKFLIKEDEILKLFKDIPFLNGGLFDCLDKENETGKVIYIDGFSRNPKKQAIIPDYLFFQEEEKKVDLSCYGLSKKKTVRGLIEILYSYNFTINENTPVDQEVALDPELLGKVFENLLAAYNPETATTARKATGSYYTPREIVDYMVDESLTEYLTQRMIEGARSYVIIGRKQTDMFGNEGRKGQLEIIEDLNPKRWLDNEEKLKEEIRKLLSYENETTEFDDEDKEILIKAIENIKILDPACGSGAFPMGILHKLVLVLRKLDPENKIWKRKLISKAPLEIREELEQSLENKSLDYFRKLGLIENCIYGIDIQEIAIQITKLRFFISLIVEQVPDDSKPNRGIRALPNLEIKFVAANTLIGLDKLKPMEIKDAEIEKMEKELKQIRHKYFTAKTHSVKSKYQDKDEELREKLAKKLAEKLKKYLTEQKQNEINRIKKIIKEKELELQKITGEPEDVEIITHKDLFGTVKQVKIDKKEQRIKKIKDEIKKLERELLNIQKQMEGDLITKIAKKISKFNPYDQNASADWFDPEWMFGVKDGFDIVIGNPPYIKEYTFRNAFDGLRKSPYYKGKMDIWYLFACKGIDLLRKQTGILTFIAQNNWVTSYGASIMRNKVIKDAQIIQILDFGSYMIFESSDIQTMVMIFKRNSEIDNYKFDYRRLEGNDLNFNDVLDLLNYNQTSKTVFLKPTIKRNNSIDKPLTFSSPKIDSILDKLSKQSNFKLRECDIAQGIVTPQDYVIKNHLKKLPNLTLGEGIFVLSNKEKNNIAFTKTELDIIKPFYTTKELFRWYGNRKNSDWIIYTDSSFKNPKKILNYPNIKKHLDKFQKSHYF